MDTNITGNQWNPRVLAGAVALTLVAGVVGYAFGSSRSGVFETVGSAHSTEAQISLEADGWTYAIPLDVMWSDATGWHEGGRPKCLPPSDADLEGIRVSAVPVETRGMGFREVVAVHCD